MVAGGRGARLSGAMPKQYITIGDKTILRHTLDVFIGMDGLKNICVVINADHRAMYDDAVRGLDNVSCCVGGETRKDSVYNGLQALSQLGGDDIVLIHDAARPFVTRTEVETLVQAVTQRHDAATLACPVVDTVRYADQDNMAGEGISRDHLWAMQTPQAFRYGLLRRAHENSDPSQHYTDDTALVSAMDVGVHFVKGGKQNFKITTQEDLYMAIQSQSSNIPTEIRTGLGYDVHAFDDAIAGGTKIRLCGVDIPHERKLKGHSDADVGLHALTDAILGAIGEGDIGLHFPPSNMDFKDMDSAVFLQHAMTLLRDKGGTLINADITLICEQPKIGPHRAAIIERIADITGVEAQRINIKATTTEQLGFEGRKEGIAAQVAVSVALAACEGVNNEA